MLGAGTPRCILVLVALVGTSLKLVASLIHLSSKPSLHGYGVRADA